MVHRFLAGTDELRRLFDKNKANLRLERKTFH
jgi:hypothetical protein